jgi:transposase-like protein
MTEKIPIPADLGASKPDRQEAPETLPDFARRFISEDACARYLYALRYPSGFVCPTCNVGQGWFLAGERVVECANRHKVSLTAGTIMHGSKQDLVTWFFAAYLVTTLTPGISAVQFQSQMGIDRYETAFNMLHKLRAALVAPDREPLRREVEVDEAYVGGPEAGRPGRGAQTKALVVCAIELVHWQDKKTGKPRTRTARVRMQVIADASADSLVPFVKATVEPGATVRTDGWAGYMPLRESGYDYQPEVQGTGKNAKYMPHVHRIFGNLKTWLKGTHHGRVTAKHLQAYLNEYTFRFNRRYWHGPAFHRALSLASNQTQRPTYESLYAAGAPKGWRHPSPSPPKIEATT